MEESLEQTITDPEELKLFVEKNIHKVRNCFDYYDEYHECNRIQGRFHQYFIFGKFLDCSNWKSDYKNCIKAEADKEKHLQGLANIIRHEDERREQRLKSHLNNDVWPRRTEPPANWNSKLPEEILERKREQDFRTNNSCVVS